MNKRTLLLVSLLTANNALWCTGAETQNEIKQKISINGEISFHIDPNNKKSIKNITINGLTSKIFMYLMPAAQNEKGQKNFEIKDREGDRGMQKYYELYVNPNKAYDKVDLVSQDTAGEIKLETAEIYAPEPDTVWIFKSANRKFEYIEIVVKSNVSGTERHYLIESSKDVRGDVDEPAGELAMVAKISTIKSLKIKGYEIKKSACEVAPKNNNAKNSKKVSGIEKKDSPKKIKAARSDTPKNRSAKIIKTA